MHPPAPSVRELGEAFLPLALFYRFLFPIGHSHHLGLSVCIDKSESMLFRGGLLWVSCRRRDACHVRSGDLHVYASRVDIPRAERNKSHSSSHAPTTHTHRDSGAEYRLRCTDRREN